MKEIYAHKLKRLSSRLFVSKVVFNWCKRSGLNTRKPLEHASVDILKFLSVKLYSLFKPRVVKEYTDGLLVYKLTTRKNYRDLRFLKGLPIRGQRTHTNATMAKYVSIKKIGGRDFGKYRQAKQ